MIVKLKGCLLVVITSIIIACNNPGSSDFTEKYILENNIPEFNQLWKSASEFVFSSKGYLLDSVEAVKILKADSDLLYSYVNAYIDSVWVLSYIKMNDTTNGLWFRCKGSPTFPQNGIHLAIINQDLPAYVIHLSGRFASEGFDQVIKSSVLVYEQNKTITILKETEQYITTLDSIERFKKAEFFVWNNKGVIVKNIDKSDSGLVVHKQQKYLEEL